MSNRGKKRLGFLGGSFDPIHLGHLLVAQDAREQAGLDQVYLVPASQAPLKGHHPAASAEARLSMVRLATEGTPGFDVLDDEIRRGGENFTIDTATVFRERWPESELYWIIGADQAAHLHRWHRLPELLGLISFLAVGRPGFSPVLDASIPPERVRFIEGHVFGISSTEIRSRLSRGQDVHLFLPPQVVGFIKRHHLYTSQP